MTFNLFDGGVSPQLQRTARMHDTVPLLVAQENNNALMMMMTTVESDSPSIVHGTIGINMQRFRITGNANKPNLPRDRRLFIDTVAVFTQQAHSLPYPYGLDIDQRGWAKDGLAM